MMSHQRSPSPLMTEPAARVAQWQARIETVLDRQLPQEAEEPQLLHRAMRYAALSGGKRFRPVLVYATGEALGLAAETLDPVAAAIEFIHAYSLIHDDLPAMDDDDLRRGRLTCHKAFDEATAILAGDALQALAFQVLAGRITSDRREQPCRDQHDRGCLWFYWHGRWPGTGPECGGAENQRAGSYPPCIVLKRAP